MQTLCFVIYSQIFSYLITTHNDVDVTVLLASSQGEFLASHSISVLTITRSVVLGRIDVEGDCGSSSV